MARTKTKLKTDKSTAQQVASVIKSCRDIMRKDKGLNGDLDRLPMLTWIMFLKFLDDMEQVREAESKMAGKRYRQSIEPPYRWRDDLADGIRPTLTRLIEGAEPAGRLRAGSPTTGRTVRRSLADRIHMS